MSAFYDAGRYRGKIFKTEIGQNKNGNTQVVVTFKLTGIYTPAGELAKMDFPYNRAVYLVLTDATVGTPDKPGWVMQSLRHLGFNGTSFAQLDPESPQYWNPVDNESDLICKHDEYEGKEREKWEVYRGQGNTASAGKPVQSKDLRALDAKFGKLLQATAAPNAQKQVAGETEALPPPPPNRKPEEIPF